MFMTFLDVQVEEPDALVVVDDGHAVVPVGEHIIADQPMAVIIPVRIDGLAAAGGFAAQTSADDDIPAGQVPRIVKTLESGKGHACPVVVHQVDGPFLLQKENGHGQNQFKNGAELLLQGNGPQRGFQHFTDDPLHMIVADQLVIERFPLRDVPHRGGRVQDSVDHQEVEADISRKLLAVLATTVNFVLAAHGALARMGEKIPHVLAVPEPEPFRNEHLYAAAVEFSRIVVEDVFQPGVDLQYSALPIDEQDGVGCRVQQLLIGQPLLFQPAAAFFQFPHMLLHILELPDKILSRYDPGFGLLFPVHILLPVFQGSGLHHPAAPVQGSSARTERSGQT